MVLTIKTNLKILCIEENQKDQEKLVKFLASENFTYQFTVVSAVASARKALDSSSFDLVLCEYKIGKFTAFDLIEELEDIPYIFLTRQGSELIAVQALKAGAADYVIKDSKDEYLFGLSAAIENAIQKKDQEKEARLHQQQLEEIVTERTHVLLESNQRLTEETLHRAQALEELRESREIYRRFFQTSRDAVFISSEDGRWIDMNESAIELFGYQQREDIWSDSILALYWDPEARKKYTKTIKDQGFTKDYPVKFRKKDGSSFDALVSAIPYEIGGKVIGYQGFIRDISEELRAEDERQQLLKQQIVINDLSIEMGTILTLDDTYQSIAAHVKELFKLEVLNFLKFDQQQECAQVEFVWESDPSNKSEELFQTRFENIDQSIQNQVIRSRKPLYIPDFWLYHQDNDLELAAKNNGGGVSGLDKDDSQFACSMLLAPVIVEDQAIGVLQLLKQETDAYSEKDLAVLTRIANVVAIGLQKAYLYKASDKLVEKLSTLQRIQQAILENLSLPTTLDVLVDQLVKELGVDAVDILYFHPTLKTLKFITQTGFRQNILQHTDLELGEGYAGTAAQSRSTIHIPDLPEEDLELTRSLEFAAEQFISYFGVPLLVKGKLVGVLEIFHRSPLNPDQEWLELLEMVAGLAAIAIDLQNLHNDLERSQTEITKAFDGIIEGWAQALELRGIEPDGHWIRVEDMTLRLARKLELNKDTIPDIRRGALLHDIGKMGIPDQVLHKGTSLTKEERKMIGRHPIDAYELLKSVNVLHSALDIPLYHHERWNGEGYPYGLSEEKIPLPARIFAIVDVWDALLTDRPYRKAWPREKALAHIKKQSGKHFDPQVVKAFLEIIEADLKLDQEQESKSVSEDVLDGHIETDLV